MKLIQRYLLALLCLSSSLTAAGEFPVYDFELIIFEDTTGRYAHSEQWMHGYEDAEQGAAGAAADPQTIRGNNVVVTPLSSARHTQRLSDSTVMNIVDIEGIGLQRFADALNSTNRYNVLVHKAWRQSGLSEEEAIDMPIDSRPARDSDVSSFVGMGTDSARPKQNRIQGTVKIVLGRYLHFYTDLVYRQPRNDVAPMQYALSPYKDYPIESHRRMRSNELHYIDHPLVGMLIMAKPVEDTGEKENANE